MKKYLSSIAIVALALASVFSFASCSKEEEDIPNKDQENLPDAVFAYETCLSEVILDLYDVKVILHNGALSQEVVLAKNDGKVSSTQWNDQKFNVYNFVFSKMEDRLYVRSTEAKVTPKADIEAIIKSMPQDVEIPFVFDAAIGDAFYYKGEVHLGWNMHKLSIISDPNPKELLDVSSDGLTGYAALAKEIEDVLTCKL